MHATMDSLKIDEGMRDLVRQLWKHCYTGLQTCEGHEVKDAYVLFERGDGWFENNAERFGLFKRESGLCCQEFIGEMKEYELQTGKKIVEKARVCLYCSAGMNGNTVYRGILKSPTEQV